MDDLTRDEGYRDKAPRRRPLRRLLVFLLILVAVLAVVVLAAYRDGTGFDVLQRYFSYGGGEEDGAVSFTYDAASNNRYAPVGDGLAVLSGTEFQILDGKGRQVWSASVSMENPALAAGGGRAAAYDVGGTELYVADASGQLLHLTADKAEPYIAVTLNHQGWMAVTAEKKGYKGCVTVYNDKLSQVFEFHSGKRFVTDGYVTDDCKSLAAVTLGQSSSVFVSDVVLYDLDSKEPKADYEVRDGLVLDITQKGDRIVTLSDTGLSFGTTGGKAEETYGFGGAYLRDYSLDGEGCSVLLLNRYQSGSVGRLVTVDDEGKELASLDVREQVLSVSAAGRYVAVLYGDKLTIYNQELQEYAALTGTDYAKKVLMRQDGSALLLASESARLFLP